MATKLLKLMKNIAIASLFLASFSFNLVAQQFDVEQIKIAYLYNFLKHVSWPEQQGKAQFTIAIYQNEIFYRQVSGGLSGRKVNEIPITVISTTDIKQASQADLVFIEVAKDTDLTTLASELRRTNTLLVTYNSVDKHNIMINLFLNPNSSAIEFEVNKSNIVYEGLNTSKELLLLGGSEIDVAELYRDTELAMQKMREREVDLNHQLTEQERLLNSTAKRLQQLDQQKEAQEKLAQQRQVELLAMTRDVEHQQQLVSSKEQQLSDTAKQLEVIKKDLAAKQLDVEEKEREVKSMARRIATNREILQQQQSQISQQGLQLNQKNLELEERSELIEQQQFYLFIMAVLIAIAVVVSLLVVWLFIKNSRTTRKLSQTLTNLKNMQDQLVQSEKLASLGQLTAGVAHEINTPLGIAVTSTSSALENTKAIKEDFENNNLTKSAISRYFATMMQSAELNMSSLDRVIELLNNFKQVAADQVVGEIREINVGEYINEVMQTLSAEMKRYRVTYHFEQAKDVAINTIPGALAQVLTNLVTNSLKHGFEQRDAGNIYIEVSALIDGVQVVYKDDGNGMTQEVLHNIYEPFYTTKRNSGGTGLGMNIVYNIIKQKLHGDIKIVSAPNQGATFTLTFPSNIAG